MTTQEKKDKIRSLVRDMLDEGYKTMIKQIDIALDSSAVDVDAWDETEAPMRLPKCILTAILQDQSTQYEGKGTSFERMIKKDVRKIRYFI